MPLSLWHLPEFLISQICWLNLFALLKFLNSFHVAETGNLKKKSEMDKLLFHRWTAASIVWHLLQFFFFAYKFSVSWSFLKLFFLYDTKFDLMRSHLLPTYPTSVDYWPFRESVRNISISTICHLVTRWQNCHGFKLMHRKYQSFWLAAMDRKYPFLLKVNLKLHDPLTTH